MRMERREFIAGAVAFSAAVLGSSRKVAAQPSSVGPEAGPFALNVDRLRLTAHDACVDRGASTAQVLVSLNEPAKQTVSLKFVTGGDTAYHDRHYIHQSGFVVFQPGEQFKLVTIRMIASLGPGEQFDVMVDWSQNNPAVTVEKSNAVVAGCAGGAPSVQPDARPLPPRPATSRVLFETDMSDFAASDTGYSASGRPIWMSELSHGREQPTNNELGYYSDAALHPGTRPWGRDRTGRFFLQARRHLDGIVDRLGRSITSATTGERYIYASSIATTKRLFNRISVGCFVEARLQLDPVFGSWPALWLLPDDERSHTLEIDMLEGFFQRAATVAPNLEMIGTTVHWSGGAAGHRMYSQSASIVESLIPGFDPFAPHVWGLHWAAEALTFFVDDVPYFQVPNVLPVKDCYLLMNIAVGGQAGVPDPASPFNPRLYVDWARVWQAG